MQGSYIGYYSSFPSFGGGFDSRTLLQKKQLSFGRLLFLALYRAFLYNQRKTKEAPP